MPLTSKNSLIGNWKLSQSHPSLSTQDLIEVEAVNLKLVTQASISVYGPEARDGFVKATVLSRRIMPKLNSKKDFAVMINKS